MKLTRRQLKNIILKEFSTTRADWEDGTLGLCRQLQKSGMSDSGIDALCAGADMSDPDEDEDEPQKAKNQNPPRKDKNDALEVTIGLKLHLNSNEVILKSKTTRNLDSREKLAKKNFGLKNWKRGEYWEWHKEGGGSITVTKTDVDKKLKIKK